MDIDSKRLIAGVFTIMEEYQKTLPLVASDDAVKWVDMALERVLRLIWKTEDDTINEMGDYYEREAQKNGTIN